MQHVYLFDIMEKRDCVRVGQTLSFTHLQVRSGYSFFNSTITIDKLVERAYELGFHSLALTDENVLYGAISFYNACKKRNIKPILGIIVSIKEGDDNTPIILLAENNDGYRQLMSLSSLIQQNSDHSVNIETFKNFNKDNIITILPVETSPLRTLFMESSFEEASQYITNLSTDMKQESFYLGVQSHGLPYEHRLNKTVKEFSKFANVRTVCIHDVRYLKEDEAKAYSSLLAMKSDEHDGFHNSFESKTIKNRYLRSENTMKELFSTWPEVVKETEKIANRCNVHFEWGQKLLPTFPVPDRMEAHDYLEKLCWENVKKRYHTITKEIKDRLTYELHTIQAMGFSDYFLIVADFVAYAKRNGILVGPGRGSAAGSLVAYVLFITDVDPLKYGLLFERFLNPERVTLPDIDIDFSDYRRDEVIHYVKQKYGKDHVAQISTFGTFAARSVLRELAKVMDIEDQDLFYILKQIPVQSNKTLKQFVRELPELNSYIQQSEKLKMYFKIATTLEGLPRHISTHAAGVVITKNPLTDYIPITLGANEMYLTQYAMDDLEKIGLLKIDFLGLKNLTILERIVHSVYKYEKKKMELEKLPKDDPHTFRLLQQGKTNGIFQFESEGMKQVLIQLKPDNFEDLVAVNALYRPGPMEFISTYIERKREKENFEYAHPDLKPILKNTYGVLVYQEQIMQIAHTFASYSYGQADILRRAVSKKQTEVLRGERERFINGCIKNGYSKEIAEQIFAWIMKFSNYGFNRSHAVAYSKVAYQLAYLKAHFPKHFFAELLSSSIHQQEKVQLYLKELKQIGIEVKAPSINKSYGKFTVEQDGIRIGLSLIKGIGNQVVKEIVRVRKQGMFKNLYDFCIRVSTKIVNRKVLELLIKAGAFDETYPNRASMLASLDDALERGELFGDFNNQYNLFENEIQFESTFVSIEDFSQAKKLADEKELLGIYISSHPLAQYRKALKWNGFISMQKAQQLRKTNQLKSAVIIQSIKEIRTKKGEKMAFITIGDETDDMEAVIFPNLYRNVVKWLKEEMLVFIKGKVTQRNSKIQWVLDSVTPFTTSNFQSIDKKRVFIQIEGHETKESILFLKQVAKQYPGESAIIVVYKNNKKIYQLEKEYNIQVTEESLSQLKKHFGTNNVVYKINS